jgi:hypothetical protein
MIKKTSTRLNAKYTPPSFERGDIVTLKRDCYSYNALVAFDEKDIFKEKCLCEIYECGLSHFYIDENEQFVEHVEDCEWCALELVGDSNDDDICIGGLIRAKDLW